MYPIRGLNFRAGYSDPLSPRWTWEPTTAACWSALPPATGSGCSTAFPASSVSAKGCTAPAPQRSRDGPGDGRPAGLRRAHWRAARSAQVRAIATEACRRATNGPEFLSRVKHETGFDFGIISSREEAELALESCAPLLPGDGRRALLFDIGGGSTELAWVRLTMRPRRH